MSRINKDELKVSWELYFSDETESYRPEYLPNPVQVYRRGWQLRWLQGYRMDEFIQAVLHDETLSFQLVRRLVKRHGRRKALKLLRRLL